MLSSRAKRAWLRIYYARSVTASRTLDAQLTFELMAAGGAQPMGLAISATSANDHSTAFSSPGADNPGPEALLELIEELLRRYDLHRAALVTAGNPAPTDLQIRDAMLAGIVAIRTIHSDFSGVLR